MKRRDFIKSPDNEVGSSASGVADSLNFCFSITLCRFRNCSLFVEKIQITFDFIRRGSRLKPLLFFIEIELYHFTEYRHRLESANSQIIKFNRLIDEQASRKLHYYDHFQISFFILYRINDWLSTLHKHIAMKIFKGRVISKIQISIRIYKLKEIEFVSQI